MFYRKTATTTSFFRKLDILPVSTCYTSGRGTIKISWVCMATALLQQSGCCERHWHDHRDNRCNRFVSAMVAATCVILGATCVILGAIAYR